MRQPGLLSSRAALGDPPTIRRTRRPEPDRGADHSFAIRAYLRHDVDAVTSSPGVSVALDSSACCPGCASSTASAAGAACSGCCRGCRCSGCRLRAPWLSPPPPCAPPPGPPRTAVPSRSRPALILAQACSCSAVQPIERQVVVALRAIRQPTPTQRVIFVDGLAEALESALAGDRACASARRR